MHYIHIALKSKINNNIEWLVQFVNELVRVAAPGGRIIIVTWCHRDLQSEEESIQPWEKQLLDKICDAYYLPDWCSAADYVNLLQSLPLEVIIITLISRLETHMKWNEGFSACMQDIKTADWSKYVAPFWPAVVRSALTWKGFVSLLRTGKQQQSICIQHLCKEMNVFFNLEICDLIFFSH